MHQVLPASRPVMWLRLWKYWPQTYAQARLVDVRDERREPGRKTLVVGDQLAWLGALEPPLVAVALGHVPARPAVAAR